MVSPRIAKIAFLYFLLPFLTNAKAKEEWWSLSPEKIQETEIIRNKSAHWSINEIDYFIYDKLAESNLSPSPQSDPRKLIRRVYFDLIGLPPSPDQVEEFCLSPSDKKYNKIIDDLLSSPHYGERWGRHWLDVARYGESNGFEYNEPRNNAWPYRDWVIKAFNGDMPYNEFAKSQICGDIKYKDRGGDAAVGFLVAGIHNTVLPGKEILKKQARADELEEMISAVGQAFLGMTLHCARCHDHKADPINTKDYYAFAANLSGVYHGEKKRSKDAKQKIFTVLAKDPGQMKIHLRGNVASLGEEILPGSIPSIGGKENEFQINSDSKDSERRSKLADWITSERNPLFSRVAVNRIWAWHFGRGIVNTPNDFGANGATPTHPKLLDWLAIRFREEGHSVKYLHRLIMNSATYRQSSVTRKKAYEVDADSTLLWRFPPRRIDAESLRDSILMVSGTLNRRAGGPGYKDTKEEHFNAGRYYIAMDPVGEEFDRRTVYRFSPRGGRPSILDAFDAPSPSSSCPQRQTTTTPAQVLSLTNSSFVLRKAKQFSERLEAESNFIDEEIIDRAWGIALNRKPDTKEKKIAMRIIQEEGLMVLCRTLFNSSQFVIIE